MHKENWMFAIYCDYGNKDIKKVIRLSFSEKSAKGAWKKFGRAFSQSNWHCWQEDRKGNIINDSVNFEKTKSKPKYHANS